MSYAQQPSFSTEFSQQAPYEYSQPAQDYGASSQYQSGYQPGSPQQSGFQPGSPQQGYAAGAPAQQSTYGYATAAPGYIAASTNAYTVQPHGVAQQQMAATGAQWHPHGAPPPANPGMGEPSLNYPPAPFRKRGASATGTPPARLSSDSFAAAPPPVGSGGYLQQPQSLGAISGDGGQMPGAYNQQSPVYNTQPSMAAGSGYVQQLSSGYDQQGADYGQQQQWGSSQQQPAGQWAGQQQQGYAAY